MSSNLVVLLCLSLALGAASATSYQLVQPLQGAFQLSPNCTITAVENTIKSVYVDSYEFVSTVLKVIAKIGLHFESCASKINPVDIFSCVVVGMTQVPGEVQEIIEALITYYGNVAGLIAQLAQQCLGN